MRQMACVPDTDPAGAANTLVIVGYRLDNLIFDSGAPRVLALLDWELANLGHRLSDLAYYCMKYHIDTLGQGCLAGVAGLPDEWPAVGSGGRPGDADRALLGGGAPGEGLRKGPGEALRERPAPGREGSQPPRP